MAKYWGMNVPFLGGPQKVLGRQEDLRLIKNDVLQLILTVPGERIYRPNFGTNLRLVIMEQMTTQTLFDLRTSIMNALEEYEPRLVNVDVQLTTGSNECSLTVKVTGTLSFDPSINFLLERTFDDLGEETT